MQPRGMWKPKLNGSLGALGAGVALGVCLGLVLLATLFDDAAKWVEASEARAAWLGFWGGFSGGLMTLVAAAVAWISVERQIEDGRRASNEQRRHAGRIQRGFASHLKQTAEEIAAATRPIAIDMIFNGETVSALREALKAMTVLPALSPNWRDVEVTFSVSPYEVIPALRACIVTDEQLQNVMRENFSPTGRIFSVTDVEKLHSAASMAAAAAGLALAHYHDASDVFHSAASG